MAFPIRNVSPEDQRKASLARLLAYIQTVIEPYSPYYREQFRQNGINVSALKTYDEFRAAVPITYKNDIVGNLDDFTLSPGIPGERNAKNTEALSPEHWARYASDVEPTFAHPFKEMSSDEQMRAAFHREWSPIHFQMSGGSTGLAITTGYTYRDIHLQFRRSAAWIYELSPRAHADIKWLNLLPAAPHLAIYAGLILPLLNGRANFNTFGGKVMPTERQIEIVSGDRFEAILAIPSYLTHWLRTARNLLASGKIAPITTFRMAVCVGEPLTQSYREIIKGLFNGIGSPDVQVLQGMSSTELRTAGFYECVEGSGLHLDPEYIFAEILHPETKEPVATGEPGVFVWSHIDWRGTAILRYWTGDYIENGMVNDPCPHCRLALPRLRTPIWRIEKDFAKIRGSRVEYVSLQDAVRSVKGVATFQIALTKEDKSDPASRDRIEVIVAPVAGADTAAIETNLRNAVMSAVEISVDSVAFGSAAEVEGRLFAKKLKAEWIVDARGEASASQANGVPA